MSFPAWMHDPRSDWWNVANVVGTWLAAIGTIGTVIVALRLASRAERPRLRVEAERGPWVNRSEAREPGIIYPDEMHDSITLEITNVGSTRVRINSVGWLWYGARGAAQPAPETTYHSHILPATLDPGEQLEWVFPYEKLLPELAKYILALAPTKLWRLRLLLLRVAIYTSTGRRFTGRLGPELKKAFSDKTCQLRSARRSAG
jgi:hypothetical protein